MKGPVINNAYNLAMEAEALDDHTCVSKINGTNVLSVFRRKLYTISSTSDFTTENVNLIKRSTSDLKLLLEFIRYHLNLAIECHTFTNEIMNIHMKAIEMIELEIQSREDSERVVSKFLLMRLIKDKEMELEILKKQLIEFELG